MACPVLTTSEVLWCSGFVPQEWTRTTRQRYQIDDLTEAQLTAYFSDLIGTHSWTTVKLDLYGLKFYTTHVLKKPWVMPNLIKPPKTQRLRSASNRQKSRIWPQNRLTLAKHRCNDGVQHRQSRAFCY